MIHQHQYIFIYLYGFFKKKILMSKDNYKQIAQLKKIENYKSQIIKT